MIAKIIAPLLLVTTLSALAANFRATNRDDEKITGIWQFMGIDTPVRLVYRRDHTLVEMFPEEDSDSGWLQFQVGTWRLEGDKIIEETRGLRIGDMVLSDRGRTETRLREIHPDRLVRAEDRPDFVRANVSKERYWQVFFLLCLVGSLISLLAVLYRGKQAPSRTAFRLLCLAASGACLWSSLSLIDALSQTGNVIVSPDSLTFLRKPAAVSGIVAVALFLVAVLRLGFSVMRFRRASSGL